MSEEKYVCVRVGELPVQALLRLREGVRADAVVVMEGVAPAERVCSASATARRAGVVDGMPRVEVESFAGVRVMARSRVAEEETKELLVEAMRRFSPRVEDASEDAVAVYVVDAAGTERLFGGSRELAGKIRVAVYGMGLAAAVVVSGNFHTAVAVAREMGEVTVIEDGKERDALAGLPLAVLGIGEEQRETLAVWGVKTVGGLAQLPEVELVARMGQVGQRLWKRARGEASHHFHAIEEVFALRRVFEFDAPVEDAETLLFVLAPMLDHLLVKARGKALAIASVTVEMALDGGGVHARTVRPALPTEDRKLLLKLIQLDLAGHAPEAGVVGLTVTAEPGDVSKVQMGLFSPQLPESSRLDVTLARLVALVGHGRVGSAVLRNTHEPDSFSMVAFRIAAAEEEEEERVVPVMRRLRPPAVVWLQVKDGRPERFAFRDRVFRVLRAYGPWKGSGAWWSLARWGREEWDLLAEGKGERLYCRVVRDFVAKRWVVEGIYD